MRPWISYEGLGIRMRALDFFHEGLGIYIQYLFLLWLGLGGGDGLGLVGWGGGGSFGLYTKPLTLNLSP